MIPAPSTEMERASLVVDDDCPVVLPTAYMPTVWIDCVASITTR